MSRRTTSARAALVLAFAAAAATACGGSDSSEPGVMEQLSSAKEAIGNASSAASALKEMGDAMAEMADSNVTVEPVDFRTLRDLLPASLAGLPRTEATGEKTGAMGMTVSKAEANYRAEGDDADGASLDVTITDMGALRGMAILGMAAWTMTEVDRESADGFERTSKHEGHPAYERFSNSEGYRSGNVQVVVARRFLVELDGQNMDFDAIKRALKDVNVGKLAGMKDQGVTRGS